MYNGKRVREARVEKGLSQRQLAFEIDSTKAQISKIENNIINKPRMSTLERIAKALEVQVQIFLN